MPIAMGNSPDRGSISSLQGLTTILVSNANHFSVTGQTRYADHSTYWLYSGSPYEAHETGLCLLPLINKDVASCLWAA
jgi:hypothetical protein